MTPDIANIIAGELKVSRATAYELMREALKEAAPVQEPVALKSEDVIVETYSTQKGGFAFKLDTGVCLIHKQTGTVVRCNSERSQHRNKEVAWRELERLLITPPAAQATPVQPMESLLAAIQAEPVTLIHKWRVLELVKEYAAQPAPPVQEPVKFLANGTRFKTSEFPYGVCINGLPKELSGRWVALVAAEDDCHLQLTTPPAAQRQWVGLTDEEIGSAYEDAAAKINYCAPSNVQISRAIEAKLKEKNNGM
jgi:hypothetical protein